MPTLRKDNDNKWMARVTVNGRPRSQMFGTGERYGPEWRKAKQWEEDVKNGLLEEVVPTLSDYEIYSKWLVDFILHSKSNDCKKTQTEKKMVLSDFSAFCATMGITSIGSITPGLVHDFLVPIFEARGPGVANRYLKNLKTAWNYGKEMIDDFPSTKEPFRKYHRYDVEEKDRYVPPHDDAIKVLEQAEGQDLVMLLLFFFTGARAGEVFRLKWHDVDFVAGFIRFTDHKGGAGKKKRTRTMKMHPDLAQALAWWKEECPCKVDNVLMQLQSDSAMGEPFTHRSKYMPRVCTKLGIKPFGFHAMRHKSAAIAFKAQGLHGMKLLTGHSTDIAALRYARSLGLYLEQGLVLEALGESDIGKAAEKLLNEAMPLDFADQEAFCNTDHVTSMIQ